jgi:hypothetical protein
VEWGIGGLKRKWKHDLMKRFDSTIPKYTHMFQVIVILSIVLHMRHMDLTFEVVGEQNPNFITRG